MKQKICKLKCNSAWYFANYRYRCQYCNGIIIDEEYLRKIITCNTPTKLKNREQQIEKEIFSAIDGVTPL